VIAEWLCRGWHLGLHDGVGCGLGAVIAEWLCRGWHLGLRDGVGNGPAPPGQAAFDPELRTDGVADWR
jgi:hypothetical protein